MARMTTQLRAMLKRGQFLELPATYDPITARIAESAGFKSIYNGGFVTGGKSCMSEPLLTMSDQIGVAGEIAKSVEVPLVMDAGAGWGEPLHTMRTVRECIWAGVAGMHIEDQLFPKRAHYHTYVVHNIPRDEFVDKIRASRAARATRSISDFVIIARSDAARVEGIKEAIDRVNAAADVGADMGLVFPRTHDGSGAHAEAREAADGLRAEPRHSRRASALQLQAAEGHGLRRLHRRDARSASSITTCARR